VIMNDYSAHVFNGEPREGQSLEEVRDLILAEIEKLKKGDFDPGLKDAVIKDLKLRRLRQFESNSSRASALTDVFIYDLDCAEFLGKYDRMSRITNEDVMAFAKKHYHDNFVTVYKRQGTDPDVFKVEKPQITPIEVNREAQSAFFREFEDLQAPRLEPVFVNFENDIEHYEVFDKVPFHRVQNPNNELFELHYIFDMGTDHDLKLGLAVKYLPYLGTNRYSPEQIQKEFFKIGLDFDVYAGRKRVYVTLKGLEESLEKGVDLFEHLLANARLDQKAYDDLVEGISKERADAKTKKGVILFRAMGSYGKYGPESPFNHILPAEELRATDPEELTRKIHELTSYQHKIYYYGTKPAGEVQSLLEGRHKIPGKLRDYPQPMPFNEKTYPETQVYYVNYDMVQAEIYMLARDVPFEPSIMPYGQLFNEYYGAGLSSIVFQEIRESKALAYAAYSWFSTPSEPDEHHYLNVYLGTQVDKLGETLEAMTALLNEMPEAEKQFNGSVEAVMRKIETDRTPSRRRYWFYDRSQKRGLETDHRELVYNTMQQTNLERFESFFNDHIRGKRFAILVIGNRNDIDLDQLSAFGEVRELELEEVFGY